MTRRLTIGLAAVLAMSVATTSMAALTGAELRQYYGGVQINGAAPANDVVFGGGSDLSTNPVIDVFAGDTVYISIWARPQLGDKTGGFTSIRAYHFEQYGTEGGQGGQFAYGGGDTRDFGGFYSNLDEPAAGNGGAHDACAERLQLVDRMGAASTSDSGMRSDGTGIGFDDAGNAAYFLGYIAITVGADAADGDSLTMYFSTPDDGALKYATNSTVGSLNTIGYGANGAGQADVARCDNTNLDVLGTVNDRSSADGDLVLHVIPEPTTLGLLAVSLLAIRRRRA